MAAKEFPGYYIVGGRKVTADGAPYKKGVEDEAAESPDQAEIRELRAQLEALQAEAKPAAAPPAPEATAKPAPGPGVSKVPGKP